ncbi:hypothetical protein E4T56_gene9515, partial [Termitomyces sp. T112]
IALFLALLVFRRRIFKRRVRPPPEIPPFALGSHGKDVAVVQRPQQQQQNLLPSTSGRPLRGILKRESESRPLYAVKASPREAKLAITEKAETKQPTLPSTKESLSQPPSGALSRPI